MITAVLRAGNRHASYGIVSILKRIVGKLKAAFPNAEIIIHQDPEGYEQPEPLAKS